MSGSTDDYGFTPPLTTVKPTFNDKKTLPQWDCVYEQVLWLRRTAPAESYR